MQKRENDAKIECWLGNLVPWEPKTEEQKERAEKYGFRWTDPSNGAARGYDYVSFYSTNDGEAVKLLPALVQKGFYWELFSAEASKGGGVGISIANPDTRDFDFDITEDANVITCFSATIAGAISDALVKLIGSSAE